MNLIYYYVSNGACAEDNIIPWDDQIITGNSYAQNIWTEGRFLLLDMLAERKHVDKTLIFIDSTRSPGIYNVTRNTTVYVVPHLKESLKYIQKGDIIWARGGFKQWYSTLQTLANNGHWIMFYRANTDRGRWPFWDIILDDLVDINYNSGGRLGYAFSKPMNENIFRKFEGVDKLEKKYDLMIGASHIHAKKGQHLAIPLLKQYREMFKINLKAVLTGGFIRSWSNQSILDELKKNDLDITYTGMLPRYELAKVMNQSKIFLHLGVGGQNDRGVLEAMACGTPCLIASPSRFSPFVSKNKNMVGIPNDLMDTVDTLNYMLGNLTTNEFADVDKYYKEKNGLNEVCLPKVIKLIDFIKKNPLPCRERLLKEFV